jgi:hypothetical protein
MVMAVEELFTKELKKLAPIKCKYGSEITSEQIVEWAIEICKNVLEKGEGESDDSCS